MKTKKKEILSELLVSEKRGNVLSIKLRGHKDPFITAIEKMLQNRIILKPTCVYGYPLPLRTITLLEIESVKRYQLFFSSPVFERIRTIKNSITRMRENIAALNTKQTVF